MRPFLRRRDVKQKVLKVAVIVALNSLFSVFSLPGMNTPGFRNDAEVQHRRAVRNDTVVLDSTVTIFVQADSPEPIEQAAEDLASDFEKVLGKKPTIVHRQEDAGTTTVLITERSKAPGSIRQASLRGPESFSISVSKNWNKKNRTDAVLLTGADMRGTIYAIYEFAQRYLDIDPLYYWTDREPKLRDSIELPASLDEK